MGISTEDGIIGDNKTDLETGSFKEKWNNLNQSGQLLNLYVSSLLNHLNHKFYQIIRPNDNKYVH